jgi:hypothetical protein
MAARSKEGGIGPWTGLGQPAWAHLGPVPGLLRMVSVPESSRCFPLLHVGPCRQFLSELDVAPYPTRFSTSWLGPRSLSSSRVESLASWSQVCFIAWLVQASRSCHKVLDELILEVFLRTLKPFINTKLQNRHAQMNLLYHGGQYQWLRYKTYANTEGKLMARLTDFHSQHTTLRWATWKWYH